VIAGTVKTRIMSRGTALRDERIRQRYTVKDFCSLVGISRTFLHTVENRRGGVSEEMGFTIVQHLQRRNPELQFADIFIHERPQQRERSLFEG